MAATPQSQDIDIANRIIAAGQALAALVTQIGIINNTYVQQNMATPLAAMATTAVNADGSLGTADGTPVSGHPIDIRVPALSGLNRAISAFSIGALLAVLQQVQNLAQGTAVTTQTTAPNLLAQITGG